MQRALSIIFIPFLLIATKYAGEFQELGVGGRACSMGGTGVAQFTDPAVIYFNPAGSFYTARGVLLMHAENFAGVVKNEFGSVVLRRGNMSFGLGVQYLSVNGIIFTTLEDTTSPPGNENQPIPYDTTGSQDAVLYINAARGNTVFSYGANVKIFYRDLAVMTGYGGGLDIGTTVNLEYLVLGLSVRDFVLSPLIWDNGTKESISPKISFGIAPVIPFERISTRLTLECDIIKYLDVEGFTINMGFECGYRNLLFGRVGIYNGNYTLGAGLKYKHFSVDYALMTHPELKNSNKISAGYIF
jgi:hypothetical protein